MHATVIAIVRRDSLTALDCGGQYHDYSMIVLVPTGT